MTCFSSTCKLQPTQDAILPIQSDKCRYLSVSTTFCILLSLCWQNRIWINSTHIFKQYNCIGTSILIFVTYCHTVFESCPHPTLVFFFNLSGRLDSYHKVPCVTFTQPSVALANLPILLSRRASSLLCTQKFWCAWGAIWFLDFLPWFCFQKLNISLCSLPHCTHP